MEKRGISQETLKIVACLTMLIDHIGATVVWQVDLYYLMRIIGRIAFPIYCFLLVEGAHYTRNPKKYALRLLIGVLLSELPFDLALNGGWFWRSNSVMITLLLGFGMIQCMKRLEGLWKLVIILPFYLAAELLWTDYAGNGILIIAMLALTRGLKWEKLLRTLGFILLLSFGIPVQVGPWSVPIELFALAGLPLMFAYQGKKLTHSPAAQWAFYLFYPVHLTVLWLVKLWMYGGI